MTAKNIVQDTHISSGLSDLHRALISITSVMNRPRNEERLIREAGVKLDQALFRLLVIIERLGPIGVVDLGGRLGRDYTTISRQVSKLEQLELVIRRQNQEDRRQRQAMISTKGRSVTHQLDQARARIAQQIFRDWPSSDFTELVRLMGKFAAAVEEQST
jgi:DNA-binding MarR family transcriptional regulator